jgi:hypothetical protein
MRCEPVAIGASLAIVVFWYALNMMGTKMRESGLVIGLWAGLSGVAWAQPADQNPQTVIQRWNGLNDRGRGCSGDNPATMQACRERDSAGRSLDRMGWCYGRRGEWVGAAEWHRCGPNSNRPG